MNKKNSSSIKEAEFDELLARWLVDELSFEEFQILKTMAQGSEDLQRRLDDAISGDELLEGVAGRVKGGAGRAPVAEVEAPYLFKYLAAAAIFLIMLGGVFFVQNSKGPQKDERQLVAKSTLSLNKCLNSNHTFHSGPDSLCDVTFDNQGATKIRLLPGSKVRVLQGTRHLSLLAGSGRVFVDSLKLSRGESLAIFLGDLRVEFLGTRVELVQKHILPGAWTVRVLDGRVRLTRNVRFYFEHFALSSAEEESRGLKADFPGMFEDEELTLEVGESIGLSPGKELQVRKMSAAALKASRALFSREPQLAADAEKTLKSLKPVPVKEKLQRIYLTDGRVMEGHIRKEGAFYILSNALGHEIRIEARNVGKFE